METCIKEVTVRIPSWINEVEAIAKKANLKPDRLRVVLHQFFLAWLKNEIIRKNKSANLLEGYFAVSSEIIKQVGTKHYARFVNLLITEGIIEPRRSKDGKRSYMPGVHAQLYRWNSPHIPPEFRIEKVHDTETIKSVYRTRDNHQKIDLRIQESKEQLPTFEAMKSYVLDTISVAPSQDYQSTGLPDDLHWFVVDEFGGRFHHRISSMPKVERQYLRLKGQEETPLRTLDIRNSQPFFTALVSNKTLIDEFLPEFHPVIAIAEKYANKPDFLLYKELCITGRIYEFLMEAKALPINNKIERDKIKEQLFRAVIYCKKRVYGADKLFQSMFKSSFPSVFSFFSDVKNLDEKHLTDLAHIIKSPKKKFKYPSSNDSHKILPCMMQRAESRMMYRVIAPRLIAAGIRFITIHDSFMVNQENVEQVENIIKHSFTGLGLPAPMLALDTR